jgi:hypothetical protein
VQNASDSSVTWSVNGLIGGSAATGTIDANGLYIAPEEAPVSGPVLVQATSVAAPTASASATVTVQNAPPPANPRRAHERQRAPL